jgi:hypothetical protein
LEFLKNYLGVPEVKADSLSNSYRNVYIKKDGDDISITNSSPDSPITFTISIILGKEIEADLIGTGKPTKVILKIIFFG